jgi:hypothetical protein
MIGGLRTREAPIPTAMAAPGRAGLPDSEPDINDPPLLFVCLRQRHIHPVRRGVSTVPFKVSASQPCRLLIHQRLAPSRRARCTGPCPSCSSHRTSFHVLPQPLLTMLEIRLVKRGFHGTNVLDCPRSPVALAPSGTDH